MRITPWIGFAIFPLFVSDKIQLRTRNPLRMQYMHILFEIFWLCFRICKMHLRYSKHVLPIYEISTRKEKSTIKECFVLHTRLLYALSLIFVLHFHYSLSSSINSVWIIYFIIKNLYLCNIFANYGLKKEAISWFDQEFDR